MKRYIIILILTAGFFCCREVFALELAGGKAVDITVTQTYASRYISKGQDAFADNDSAYHSSLDITFPTRVAYSTSVVKRVNL